MAFLSPTAYTIFKNKKTKTSYKNTKTSSKKTKPSSKKTKKSSIKTKPSSKKRISKSNISSPQNTNNVKRYLSDLQEYDAKMKIYTEHMSGPHTYSMLKPKKPNPILLPKHHKYNSSLYRSNSKNSRNSKNSKNSIKSNYSNYSNISETSQ